MRIRAIAFALAGLLSTATAAGAFPDRTLRVVVGFAAGGTGGLVSRLVAEMAGPALGQTVVVENRTGANGMIAAEHVARGAPPDGHTVLQCPMGGMTISPELPGLRLPIDPGTDLVPVANVARSSYGMWWRRTARIAVSPICWRRRGRDRGRSVTPAPASAPRSTSPASG
jgi:tripartite-type tricarboxylate transporter receptor subunit TctC